MKTNVEMFEKWRSEFMSETRGSKLMSFVNRMASKELKNAERKFSLLKANKAVAEELKPISDVIANLKREITELGKMKAVPAQKKGQPAKPEKLNPPKKGKGRLPYKEPEDKAEETVPEQK
jgi:hypothetical protein